MTGPPRRWGDDSPEEDFEAHRAREHDRLTGSQQDQAARELAARLGLPPPPGREDDPAAETYPGPLHLPPWWPSVSPGPGCPWCQRPGVPAPCPDCQQGHRAAASDPAAAAAWTWWERLSPGQRRLYIAARFGVDPWSGRPARISIGWAHATPDGGLDAEPPARYLGCTPDGIYWGARRYAG